MIPGVGSFWVQMNYKNSVRHSLNMYAC